jgi:hypothetical protein
MEPDGAQPAAGGFLATENMANSSTSNIDLKIIDGSSTFTIVSFGMRATGDPTVRFSLEPIHP